MNCWICFEACHSFHVSSTNTTFYQCGHCGFTFKNQKHWVSPSDELARYREHKNEIDDPEYRRYFHRFVEKAIVPFTQPKKVLDYGAGETPVLAHVLRHDYHIEVAIYDYYFYPDRKVFNDVYDVVTATEVIEHMADPYGLFDQVDRCLKPSGLFCLMTQFRPPTQIEFEKWFYHRDSTHIAFYTMSAMKILAENRGFELLYSDLKKVATFRRKV